METERWRGNGEGISCGRRNDCLKTKIKKQAASADCADKGFSDTGSGDYFDSPNISLFAYIFPLRSNYFIIKKGVKKK
jgi:hypothetical protein